MERGTHLNNTMACFHRISNLIWKERHLPRTIHLRSKFMTMMIFRLTSKKLSLKSSLTLISSVLIHRVVLHWFNILSYWPDCEIVTPLFKTFNKTPNQCVFCYWINSSRGNVTLGLWARYLCRWILSVVERRKRRKPWLWMIKTTSRHR